MRGVEVVFNSLAKSMVRLTIGKELLSVLRIDYLHVSFIRLLTISRQTYYRYLEDLILPQRSRRCGDPGLTSNEATKLRPRQLLELWNDLDRAATGSNDSNALAGVVVSDTD
jgi:hypothetical protein